MKTNSISIRKLLIVVFFSFSVPAMILLFSFSFFTVQRQVNAEISSYQDNLSAYGSNLERVLENTTDQLNSIAYGNSLFRLFSYAESVAEKHTYANELMKQLTLIQNQENLVVGFFLYSLDPYYHYPLMKVTYSYDDTKLILTFLSEAATDPQQQNRWIPFELKDRIVYLRATAKDSNLIAAMIDPSFDSQIQEAVANENGIYLFFTTQDGIPLHPLDQLQLWDGSWTDSTVQNGTYNHQAYRLIKHKLTAEEIYLCYLIPKIFFWNLLTFSEKMIILLFGLLIFSVPFLWLILYRQLLKPLSALSAHMEQIIDAQDILQVPETQSIAELRDFSKTLNYMLNNIRHLKLEAYERKLDLQQAQLQYLHLQIRPHFYINCLKNIYSLAEKQKYEQIQQLTLSLSDYFRYVFRDNKKMVTLSDELHSVKSYVTLQQLNYNRKLSLHMEIDARATDVKILPLSLLTFVENSIKHAHNASALDIHIQAHLLGASSSEPCLNMVVSDNNGGFLPEDLERLNHIQNYKSLYDDYHVGISNIYYRMEFTYHEKGMLFFYNQGDGSCVEITIPILREEEAL